MSSSARSWRSSATSASARAVKFSRTALSANTSPSAKRVLSATASPSPTICSKTARPMPIRPARAHLHRRSGVHRFRRHDPGGGDLQRRGDRRRGGRDPRHHPQGSTPATRRVCCGAAVMNRPSASRPLRRCPTIIWPAAISASPSPVMPCRSSTARWTAGQLARWRRFANAIPGAVRQRRQRDLPGLSPERRRWPHHAEQNWNGYTLIDEIAVSADARRQGIAGALLDCAKQWARQQKPQV